MRLPFNLFKRFHPLTSLFRRREMVKTASVKKRPVSGKNLKPGVGFVD